MFLRRSVTTSVLLSFLYTALYSQTGAQNPATAVFQSKVRVVLLDVVVTDRNDQPVSNLSKDDFQILEEGKPQTIASFEEHKGTPPEASAVVPLPPDYYSNYPQREQSDALNVLVLDALNTPLGDQVNVRQQMIEYLKNIQPGPQLAIFTLTSKLRMVEGFSASPKALLAALNNKKWGSGPQSSPLLRTDAEDNADQEVINNMAAAQAPPGAIQAMKDFMDAAKTFQTYSRVQTTLRVLQQLARYLGGVPGRKNIIWFSGSFPVSILPTQGQNYDFNFSDQYKDELRRITNMLAAAQIAIYPISAEGITSNNFYTASKTYTPDLSQFPGPASGSNLGRAAAQDQNTDVQQEDSERNANQATMDEVAKDTGGEAFYNTNGLKDALARVVSNGTHYYAISYSPTDKKLDGGYRPINVKLRNSHYKLAYRRGYFADSPKETKDAEGQPNQDPLQPMMERGMPDATEVLYKIRVLRSGHQPDAQSKEAGDNAQIKGPTTRYAVDFAVAPDDLDLELTQDGVRHGNVEVVLVAYDHDGAPLNWTSRQMNLTIPPKLYAMFEQGGVQLHQEIDVPGGDTYLRTGVYDLSTNKAGTLEIPLSEVKETAPPEPAMASMPAKPESAVAGPDTKADNSPTPTTPNSSLVAAATVPSIPPAANTSAAAAKPVRPMSESELTKKIASYCKTAASTSQHSDALESACRYALSLRMKLPNIICSQDTERHWWTPVIEGGGRYVSYGEARRDHVTAQVEYRNRQEYYSDVRIDGQLIKNDKAQSVGAASSDGEFAMILQNIFIPSSKAEFHFVKADNVHSVDALVFQFNIQQSNNRYYVLQAIDSDAKSKVWYPAYHGQIWLDKNTFHILRLERDTEEMPKKPIKSVKTTTDYKDVALGDGTSFLLPMASDVETCLESGKDKCSYNMITFINWHKFGTKTQIMMDASQ
jgi:VWFA-related protein